jgi:hypothetical protein
VLGPIYGGLPDVGCVDFTDAGADLWLRLCERREPTTWPVTYTDVVHEKTTHYFRTAAAAVAAIEDRRRPDDTVIITGPTPIGPWRAQWWRRFPASYRIEIEERRQWQGGASGGGESCYLDDAARRADPDRLRHVLDCHNVTLAEWLVLDCTAGNGFPGTAAHLCRGAVAFGGRLLGAAVPEDLCREGLEACLRYGWLRVVDQHTDDEVKSLLDADPAHLALPRTAENRPGECYYHTDPRRPGNLVPVPMPVAHRWGGIDFSPDGARLYRMIQAERLGPDWEDALHVSREYYWEEHCYSTSEEGFERVVQEHIARGVVVQASRVVPIGPWCVHWWERFPAGYRLELELCEP